jgi:hypothetical protein
VMRTAFGDDWTDVGSEETGESSGIIPNASWFNIHFETATLRRKIHTARASRGLTSWTDETLVCCFIISKFQASLQDCKQYPNVNSCWAWTRMFFSIELAVQEIFFIWGINFGNSTSDTVSSHCLGDFKLYSLWRKRKKGVGYDSLQ